MLAMASLPNQAMTEGRSASNAAANHHRCNRICPASRYRITRKACHAGFMNRPEFAVRRPGEYPFDGSEWS
ncbi:hypothetical protein GCM10009525_58180 [Streptosporangium amethystogenes subsp. fukuiense]